MRNRAPAQCWTCFSCLDLGNCSLQGCRSKRSPVGHTSCFVPLHLLAAGYEPTSMRAIRARYNPYVQAGCSAAACLAGCGTERLWLPSAFLDLLLFLSLEPYSASRLLLALVQARARVDQLRRLGHSVDKVGHAALQLFTFCTVCCMPECLAVGRGVQHQVAAAMPTFPLLVRCWHPRGRHVPSCPCPCSTVLIIA